MVAKIDMDFGDSTFGFFSTTYKPEGIAVLFKKEFMEQIEVIEQQVINLSPIDKAIYLKLRLIKEEMDMHIINLSLVRGEGLKLRQEQMVAQKNEAKSKSLAKHQHEAAVFQLKTIVKVLDTRAESEDIVVIGGDFGCLDGIEEIIAD